MTAQQEAVSAQLQEQSYCCTKKISKDYKGLKARGVLQQQKVSQVDC